MDFRDITRQVLEECMKHLGRALDGLSIDDAGWQPKPGATHIRWMTWQIARIEDRWVNGYIAGNEQVWTAGGWDRKFRLPADSWGYGMTAEQVAGFPPVSAAQLIAYHAAVRPAALKVLEGLTAADLERSYDEPGRNPDAPNPGPTVGGALAHLLSQQAQYTGSVRYLRGLLAP